MIVLIVIDWIDSDKNNKEPCDTLKTNILIITFVSMLSELEASGPEREGETFTQILNIYF